MTGLLSPDVRKPGFSPGRGHAQHIAHPAKHTKHICPVLARDGTASKTHLTATSPRFCWKDTADKVSRRISPSKGLLP